MAIFAPHLPPLGAIGRELDEGVGGTLVLVVVPGLERGFVDGADVGSPFEPVCVCELILSVGVV